MSAADIVAAQLRKGERPMNGSMNHPEDGQLALRSGSMPLTLQQRFYWLINQRDDDWKRFDTFALRISGSLSIERVRRSVRELTRRHGALRTRIVSVDGELRQYFDEDREPQLDVQPLDEIFGQTDDAKSIARRYVEEFAAQPCDLAAGPLLRVKVFKLSENEHVLAWSIHHLIFDMHSLNLMFREFWSLYGTALSADAPQGGTVPFQYKDYTVWQQGMQRVWEEKHRDSWQAHIAGAPGVQWPLEAYASGTARGLAKVVQLTFDETLSAGLRDLARRIPTLLSLEMLAVYIATISRWCNQKDFVVAAMVTGRDRTEHDPLIGLLSHPVFLRVHVTDDDTLLELLSQVSREFFRAILRNDFGGSVSERPEVLAGTLFTWFPWNGAEVFGRPTADEAARLDSTVEHFPFTVPEGFAPKLDIEVAFNDTTPLRGVVIYRDGVFKQDAMDRFAHELRSTAERFAANPNSRAIDPGWQAHA